MIKNYECSTVSIDFIKKEWEREREREIKFKELRYPKDGQSDQQRTLCSYKTCWCKSNDNILCTIRTRGAGHSSTASDSQVSHWNLAKEPRKPLTRIAKESNYEPKKNVLTMLEWLPPSLCVCWGGNERSDQ